MNDDDRREQLAGIRAAIQNGAFQPMGMNEAKRMLEKHLRGEKAKDDTVTVPRSEYDVIRKEYDALRADLSAARTTADYWKAEHNAANARVAELERERDKYKAWHDKVMAQTVYTERTRTFHGMECVYESISRPQPLKENE